MNYYDSPELSYSKLKLFMSDPKEYEAIYVTKTKLQEETEAMRFGNKFHSYLLEKESITNNYLYEHTILEEFMSTSFAAPVKDRILKGKLQHASIHTAEFKYWFENIKSGNKEIIRDKEVIILENMKKSVDKAMKENIGFIVDDVYKIDKKTGLLKTLDKIKIEEPSFFTDSYSGIACKTKIDFLIEPCSEFLTGLIIEYKTIAELISRSNLRKHLEQMHYYIQLYFNITGYQKLYNLPADVVPRFFWCVVEKKENRYYCTMQEAQTMEEPSYYEVAKSHFIDRIIEFKYAKETGIYNMLDFTAPHILTPSDYLINYKNNPDILFNEV